MTLARILCALTDHKPGDYLFRYKRHPPEIAQHPRKRGATEIVCVGRRCERCGCVVAEEVKRA